MPARRGALAWTLAAMAGASAPAWAAPPADAPAHPAEKRSGLARPAATVPGDDANVDGAEPTGSPPPAPTSSPRKRSARAIGRGPGPRVKRFLIGLEALGLQTPTLQPTVARVDTRYLGPGSAAFGLALIGRVHVATPIAVEVGIRSAAERITDAPERIDRERIFADFSLVAYLLRHHVVRIAVVGGATGIGERARYSLVGGRSSQRWLSGAAHVGLSLEIWGPRLALIGSLRVYGVGRDPHRVSNRGPAFDHDPDLPAPAGPRETWFLGTVGVGYRF